MSDSVQPHRRQPTRLPRPWDSPGKNTGVGCHFLLQCRKVTSENEVAQSCPTLSDPMDHSPPGSSVHGIFQARVLEWGAIAFSKMGMRGKNKGQKKENRAELLSLAPLPTNSLTHTHTHRTLPSVESSSIQDLITCLHKQICQVEGANLICGN